MFYFVFEEVDYESLKLKTKINSNHIISDWLNFLRDVCSAYFIRHPVILGGIGKRVELDEVHLVKRKYQV
jgi:hypothetical protein